ncbi:MAG TPA: hypothetical protein VMV81_01005 [Phycisphaerae bacterium]|nr:hypothetical protein [Phycisphaerae bacterium]
MAQISHEKRRSIAEAIATHDFLHRVQRQIENLHRVVFHEATLHLDKQYIRKSAEEILIAEIVSRHQGNIDGIYFHLRNLEDSGRSWAQAIAEYSAYIHNYYTTPLGVVLRRDLFGEDSHFVTPAAGRYAAYQPGAVKETSQI